MINYSVDDIYRAIQMVETAGLDEDQQYIRVRKENKPPEGSSAFGPLQITKAKFMDAMKLPSLSGGERSFLSNYLLRQADLGLKYGGDDMMPGFEAYDYGGPMMFSPQTKQLFKFYYPAIAKKLIQHYLNRLGSVDDVLERWHGSKDEVVNKKYANKVKANLPERAVR